MPQARHHLFLEFRFRFLHHIVHVPRPLRALQQLLVQVMLPLVQSHNVLQSQALRRRGLRCRFIWDERRVLFAVQGSRCLSSPLLMILHDGGLGPGLCIFVAEQTPGVEATRYGCIVHAKSRQMELNRVKWHGPWF